ncbi:MAG: Trehalose transport system permease protein SugB [Firmicutes bacterium ADurb.Bin419]|nr:MAG: Trehalose transport system permease protein SugB [Firmicutes bacterium ADurb.Bin419]
MRVGYFESIKRKKRMVGLLGNIILAIFALISLAPIVYMVCASLMTHVQIATSQLGIPNRFYNYIEVWENLPLAKYFLNSLVVCSVVTVVALIIATLSGYALAKYKFPGSGVIGIIVLATQMLPGMMFLLPLYMNFVNIQNTTGFKMTETLHGLILIYSAFYVPFSIWIIRGFFASIPGELEEAARIDGCNKFSAFYRVMLPLAVPGIIATAVYIFLMAWDELLFAWVLGVQTVPVGIRNFIGFTQARYDLLLTAGTVVTLPVLVAFFSLQKYFISGMTAGAVKG